MHHHTNVITAKKTVCSGIMQLFQSSLYTYKYIAGKDSTSFNQKQPMQFGFVCLQYCGRRLTVVILIIRLKNLLFKMSLFLY